MNDTQLLRYSRQILLPQVNIMGQEKLAQATVLIIGVGGLGSPVAMYLAAAGIGHLILIDHDRVDIANLQRQIVHDTNQLGMYKTVSAQRKLQALNPEVQITTLTQPFEETGLESKIQETELAAVAKEGMPNIPGMDFFK